MVKARFKYKNALKKIKNGGKISFVQSTQTTTTAKKVGGGSKGYTTVSKGNVLPRSNPPRGGNRNWTTYNRNSPAVAGSSSAWYKSVLDPAHAREYGCVGIPDENRDPSVVVCRRRDGTISPGWFVGQRCLAYLPSETTVGPRAKALAFGWVISTIVEIADITRVNMRQYPQGGILIEVFGHVTVESDRTTSKTPVTIGDETYPAPSLYIHSIVDRVILVTEDALEAAEQSYEAMNGSTNFSNNVKTAVPETQCRIISSSMTASNVTAMTSRGGYFTAGHCPMSLPHPSQSDLDLTGLDESEVSYLGFVPSLDSYATYSGGPDAGVYVISRPRNVHNMLIWETSDDNVSFVLPPSVLPRTTATQLRIDASDGGAGMLEYYWDDDVAKRNLISTIQHDANSVFPRFSRDCTWTYLHQTVVAWDTNWFSWFPNTAEWTLRITRYYNYEKKLSYDEGGTDGARSDRNSINLLMAALDKTELVFDHTHNDGKKVKAVIRRIYSKYGKDIMAAAGTLGAPRFARQAADLLLRGWLS